MAQHDYYPLHDRILHRLDADVTVLRTLLIFSSDSVAVMSHFRGGDPDLCLGGEGVSVDFPEKLNQDGLVTVLG